MNSLSPLASLEDVCQREEIDPSSLSELQKEKIEALLEDASAKVRRFTRQNFERKTSVAVLRGGSRMLSKLPQKPVIRIISINGEPFEGDSLRWEKPLSGVIEVEYEHGYEEIPGDIRAVVCGMVQRTMNIHKSAKSAISQQSVGPYSISFANWALGGNLNLSPEERRALKPWKQPLAGRIYPRR